MKRAQQRGEVISTVVTGAPPSVFLLFSALGKLNLCQVNLFRHPDAQFRRSCEEISPGTYHFDRSLSSFFTLPKLLTVVQF